MSSYQDIIISSVGEFGRSQLFIVLASHMPRAIIAWSMIIMSFAGAQPDWWRVTTFYNETSMSDCSLLFFIYIIYDIFVCLCLLFIIVAVVIYLFIYFVFVTSLNNLFVNTNSRQLKNKSVICNLNVIIKIIITINK